MQPQVAIIRIVGNELPPRHATGSALAQLTFILAHEPNDPRLVKGWVLNRILDHDLQNALIALLEAHAMPYRVRALDGYAYAQLRKHSGTNDTARTAGLMIQINTARNAAMAWGAELAPWTVPLDGGCCFDAAGLAHMLAVLATPARRVYAIPTYRLGDNAAYADFATHIMTEPMLVLESDMVHPFDESIRYGECDKLATLRRLFRPYALEDTPHGTVIRDPRLHAGYVLRLSSGTPAAEGTFHARVRLREHGLRALVKCAQARYGSAA